MPSFVEARKIVLDSVVPLGIEKVEILSAVGRVLAEDVAAPWDMPLWDNTAMDGYAVHAVDCPGGGTLKLAGFLPAGGHMTAEVERGTAVKIMTGAPIPPGADAVVPYEETEESDGRVSIISTVKPGDHIRFKGEDVRSGETVLPAGTLLRPSEISMLASFGKIFVPVRRRVRVAILSTGDELVEPGEALEPGKIVNSNSLALAAAVTQAGGIPVMLGIARDNRDSLREKMVEGLRADVLITSAGVSAGDCDYVRDVLSELMVVQAFWKVDIKPGRPTAFGLRDGKPVFSLPGNPVSSLLTFEEFVRPALLKMMGHTRVLRPMVKATLQEDVRKKPGRVNFIRVAVTQENGEFLVQSAGKQDTGFLKTLLLADGIAVIPADCEDLRAGDQVDVHLLD
jgi:molybdopterin molybdotransferase